MPIWTYFPFTIRSKIIRPSISTQVRPSSAEDDPDASHHSSGSASSWSSTTATYHDSRFLNRVHPSKEGAPTSPKENDDGPRSDIFSLVLKNKPDVFQSVMQDYLTKPLASAETVDLFIRHGEANVNDKTKEGVPFLLAALNENHPRVFKRLLQHPEIRRSEADRRGRTPFLAAVIQGNLPAVKSLMKGPHQKIDPKSPEAQKALEWASGRGDKAILVHLLSQWRDSLSLEAQESWLQRYQQQHHLKSKFSRFELARQKHAAIKFIQDKPVAMHVRGLQAMHGAGYPLDELIDDVDEVTPLRASIEKGSLPAVQTLIMAGVDLNRPDSQGRTPLMVAAHNRRLEVAQMLLDSGAKINEADQKGYTALYYAIPALHEKSMEAAIQLMGRLIRAGADVNYQSEEGISPLHVAVSTTQSDLRPVQLLLAAGADASLLTHDRYNVLHYALLPDPQNPECNAELLALLLQKKVNINQPNQSGQAPLHFALLKTRQGDAKIAQMLLDAGADITAADNAGNTILHYAFAVPKGVPKTRFTINPDFVKVLLERGAKVNQPESKKGRMPLHYAVLNSDSPYPVKVLLEAEGIRIDARNHKGKTPLGEALTTKKYAPLPDSIKELLLRYGATE